MLSGKRASRRSLRPDRLRSQAPGENDRLEAANSPATPPPRHLIDDKVAQSKELLSLENSDKLLGPSDLEDETEAPSTPVDETKDNIKSKTTRAVETLCVHEENTRTTSVPHSHVEGNANPRSWEEVNSEDINSISPKDGIGASSLSTPEGSIDALAITPIEHMDRGIDAPFSDQEDLTNPRTDIVDLPENPEAAIPDDERTVVTSVTTTSPAKTATCKIQPSHLMDGQGILEIIAPETEQPVLATQLTSDDSILHPSGVLEDASVAEEIPLGQTRIEAYERSSSPQSIFGGPETDQRNYSVAKDENVIIDSLEVTSTTTPVHSAVSDDEDESSSTTSSLLEDQRIREEYCREPEYRQYHEPSEGEILEFIMNKLDHVPKDEDLAIDGGELDTNTANTEATAISEAASKPIKGPVRQTRSAARFSDDTSLLQDFLNRAQASKAAKDVKEDFKVPVYIPAPIPPPRRSSRKALAEKDRNSPSPQKPNPRDLANRPGTPPGKPSLEAIDLNDANDADEAAAPKACRRSTRRRLFAPPKAAAGAPSCIPVRRPDGTEPIVLPKSHAQELANITRANTRRNKGQSKPPTLTLKSLSADSAGEVMAALIGRSDARAVGWDQTLVYYQNGSWGKEGKGNEETRSKVGRLRNLGAKNGTPAPKKLVPAADGSNEASAPKRRSRSKSKSKVQGK